MLKLKLKNEIENFFTCTFTFSECIISIFYSHNPSYNFHLNEYSLKIFTLNLHSCNGDDKKNEQLHAHENK